MVRSRRGQKVAREVRGHVGWPGHVEVKKSLGMNSLPAPSCDAAAAAKTTQFFSQLIRKYWDLYNQIICEKLMQSFYRYSCRSFLKIQFLLYSFLLES